MVKAGTKYEDTNGLLCILPAALELLYTVTVNINTTDGLINGAPCTLKKYSISIKQYVPILHTTQAFSGYFLGIHKLDNSGSKGTVTSTPQK